MKAVLMSPVKSFSGVFLGDKSHFSADRRKIRSRKEGGVGEKSANDVLSFLGQRTSYTSHAIFSVKVVEL